MKYYFLCILSISFFLANCQPFESKLRCIEATCVFPDFNLNGTFEKYDTNTVKLYFLGDKRLYDLVYQFTTTKNGKIIISEERHHYVAFNVDSTYGYDLNITSGILKRVKLDSLLKIEWIVQNKLYPILTSNIAIHLETKENKDSGTIVERYLIKSKVDSSDLAINTYTYTNNIIGIDFSLAKELDSIKQMKLIKVESNKFPLYFKEYNFTLKKYTSCYSIKEGEIIDEKKILSYFKMLHAL